MYDIIGDIHGHADILESLLRKLGYQKKSGAYRHPERRAIFLGDLIDRGTQQQATLAIVFGMLDSGSAQCVAGNHEFNAIAYGTMGDSGYLREHSTKNSQQHAAFLHEFPLSSQRHRDILSRLKELPVTLDFGDFRCVHACWHQPTIDRLACIINDDGTLPDALLVALSTPGTEAYNAIELLLKGPEVDLPESVSFTDAQGVIRTRSRILWWDDALPDMASRLLLGSASARHREKLNTLALNLDALPVYTRDQPPVFFGHYWLKGKPRLMTENAVCLDFSVAKNGYLAAYRWQPGQALSSENFVFVGHNAPTGVRR